MKKCEDYPGCVGCPYEHEEDCPKNFEMEEEIKAMNGTYGTIPSTTIIDE